MLFTELPLLQTLPLEWRARTVELGELETFVAALQQLLAGLNDKETEEHNKNLVRDFLKAAFAADYADTNTKGRVDLAVYQDGMPVVLIEAKAPGKHADFPTPGDLNTKALHELVRYYMAERLEHANNRITQLIITNGLEWYILQAQDVERHFCEHTAFRKAYQSWAKGDLTSQKTDHFYKEIARPHIAQLEAELPYLYLNLRELGTLPESLAQLRNHSTWLQAFRVLHPHHLLKKPLPNRGNTLNRPFYEELLHVLGLQEEGTKNPKPITRLPEAERQPGALMENVVATMVAKGKKLLEREPLMSMVPTYGTTYDEQVFNMAFELVSTWLNRILFLKLLEGQLVSYHVNNKGEPGDARQAFLHTKKIPDFFALRDLFFQVLAERPEQREQELKELFGHVPYLNSSLFERTALEEATGIEISSLYPHRRLLPYRKTVLRVKPDTPLDFLPYLFDFLDAYDFSTVEVREVRAGNRGLIDARVLGLVFEKLNGYKDGSFYTPSFVTMFMAREAVQRAVVNSLNRELKWDCPDYAALRDRVECLKKEERPRVSGLIRQLRVVDPAVGSGHFLVSVLNQLIYTLWELELLYYHDSARGKDSDKLVLPARYTFSIVEDELLLADQNGDRLRYHLGRDGKPNAEVQALQETLFHLKQELIENCLFGVDLNPASVYICRLRLWIELLKHAYYAAPHYRHMETLPNLDINIKPGNSLASKFRLHLPFVETRNEEISLALYLSSVHAYKHEKDIEEKGRLTAYIDKVKKHFTKSFRVQKNDPLEVKRTQLESQLMELTGLGMERLLLSIMEVWSDESRKKKIEKITSQIQEIEQEIKKKETGILWRNAFEWRFEYPEVLDERGDFAGFDLVIGNPPYIRQEQIQHLKRVLEQNYDTYTGRADIYVFFFELGYQLLRPGGTLAYITSNKFMRAGYGEKLRAYLQQHMAIRTLVDFGDLPVFDEAIAYPAIYVGEKRQPEPEGSGLLALTVTDKAEMKTFAQLYDTQALRLAQQQLEPTAWRLEDPQVSRLLDKMRRAGTPLGEYVSGKIFYGIKTGLNEAFVVDAATKDRLIAEDPRSIEVLKPFLRGRDIKRYEKPVAETWLILLPKGITIKSARDGEPLPAFLQGTVVEEAPARYGTIAYEEAEEWLKGSYPAIYKWLLPFREKAEARANQGDFWWELGACSYYPEFLKPKIEVPAIVSRSSCTLDTQGAFSNDKTTIITGEKVLLVLPLLNSRAAEFFMKCISPTRQNDYYEYKPVYLARIPIPKASKAQQKNLEKLAQQVMDAKAQGADTANLEAQIDTLVYELYSLSTDEIALIEQG
ncbi:MAG: Eco57I restriction-modification methylase domain-containing protein [Sphingobacteriia bacterium]|jgi:adenine-specific DNA-methyltransferase